MNISAIRKAAREFGLLSLSKKTGLARSYLYRVIEGESSPTLDAFGRIRFSTEWNKELSKMQKWLKREERQAA